MTWLSISHSFLFSAFTLELVSDPSSSTAIRRLLRHAIPFIGIVSAVTVGLAILAAQEVGRQLRRRRAGLERRLGAAVARPRWAVGLGDLPPRLLPWLLSVIWSVLLWQVIGAR